MWRRDSERSGSDAAASLVLAVSLPYPFAVARISMTRIEIGKHLVVDSRVCGERLVLQRQASADG
jgi:hypothetical protein